MQARVSTRRVLPRVDAYRAHSHRNQPPSGSGVQRNGRNADRNPADGREIALPAFLQLGQDLEAGRAVPGDDERVVERMDHGLSARDRQPLCSARAKKANTQTSRDECASPSEPSGRPNERSAPRSPADFWLGGRVVAAPSAIAVGKGG